MATLKQRITDLTASLILKLNLLNTNKQNASNRKVDLTSTSNNDYPSVPAVKTGLATNLTSSKSYTDAQLAALPAYIPLSEKGANGGVVPIGSGGTIDPKYLPSYVDDIVDLVDFVTANPTSGMTAKQKYYNSTSKKIFTATNATTGVSTDPEQDKVYVKISDSQVFRWSGSTMTQLAGGLVLGQTASTAGRGDHTAAAYTHSQLVTGNPHNVTKTQVGLGNADNTSDADKPVSIAQAAAILVVQTDLDNYRTNEVGTDFPDYAAQLNGGLNF